MSEVKNEVSKMDIRGELNQLFVMSKFIVSTLDAAVDNEVACKTLRAVSEGLLNQAAYVCAKVNCYADELKVST